MSTPPPETPAPAPSTEAPPGPAEPAVEEDRRSTWQPGLYLRIAMLLAAIGYSIAFVVENSKEITIDFVFATAKVRLVWEILLLLGVGILGGILFSQLYRHRRRAQLAKKSR